MSNVNTNVLVPDTKGHLQGSCRVHASTICKGPTAD